MAWITSLALASAALLRVGWQGGCYSLFIPARTGTVNFCPWSIFRSCSSFIDCFDNLHAFKHVACLLVGPLFKIPSLYVGLLRPRVGDGVEEDLVELFRIHLLCDAQSR